MKKLFIIAMIVTMIVAALPGIALAAGDIEVTPVTFPVTLSDQQNYTIAGYLYTRQGNPNDESQCGKRSRTVQVLLSGATYNHTYWDAPAVNGVDYSYARFMAGQCYSVLALDRLGTGASSRPDGNFITKVTEADAIAQVLSSLRTNHNPAGRRFKRIVLVSHSFGSFLSVYTLGEYGNVADALVVTGWLHSPDIPRLDSGYVTGLLTNPAFASYITVDPPVRSLLFYHAPAADPMVIAQDNATMNDTLPRGFFLDGIGVFTARAYGDVGQIKALTKVDQVNVPVFVQLGDNDVLFPSAVAGAEASFYSSAPLVTVDNLTNIGHGFNLHTNHLAGWQNIEGWILNNVVNN